MKITKGSRQLGFILITAMGIFLTGCSPISDGQQYGLRIFSWIVAALGLAYGLYLSIKEHESVFLSLIFSLMFGFVAVAAGLLFISLYNTLSPYPILLALVGAVIVGLIAFLIIQSLRPPDVEKLKAKGNIPGLIKALGYKKNWAIRVAAAKALVGIGSKAFEMMEKHKQIAVEPLVATLESAGYSSLEDIANTLEKLEWKPDKSEAGFWYWIGKQNWDEASALGPPFISKLANLVEKRVPNVPDRAGIMLALGKIGTPDAVEPILATLKNDQEDDNVRQAAAKVLVKIGVDGLENNNLLNLALLEEINTKDPNVAVQMLFDKALLAAPILTVQTIEHQYEDIRHRWASLKLVKGSAEETKELILENLKRHKREVPHFQEFTVRSVIYARAVQVHTMFSNSFIPIRIWRASDSYYVCGNSQFKSIL